MIKQWSAKSLWLQLGVKKGAPCDQEPLDQVQHVAGLQPAVLDKFAIKFESKQWKELLEWLASLDSAVKFLFLRGIVDQIDDEAQKLELKTLLRETEEELASSPEWKNIPKSIDIEKLFPTASAEETLEKKLNVIFTENFKELAEKIGAELYKSKLDISYVLPPEKAASLGSELYNITKATYEQRYEVSKDELQKRIEDIEAKFGTRMQMLARTTPKEERARMLASERMIERMKNTVAYHTRKAKDARERDPYTINTTEEA